MSTSYELIGLVRGAIGTQYVRASDTAVARALGVSRAAVSGYKTGKHVMSLETFARACELARLADQDVMELFGRLIVESAGTDERRQFWQRTLAAIRAAASRGRRAAAVMALAVGAAALGGAPAPSQAAQDDARGLYIMTNRRRLVPA